MSAILPVHLSDAHTLSMATSLQRQHLERLGKDIDMITETDIQGHDVINITGDS